MTRVWVRVAMASVAIAATLAIALDTFVIQPVGSEATHTAQAAAAVEAQLVAQLVRHGYAPSVGAVVLTRHTPPPQVAGSAPTGDGRYVRVPIRESAELTQSLGRGLLLVLGTGLLAGAGWALWVGVTQARGLAGVCRTIQELGRGDLETAARTTTFKGLASDVDQLRAALLSQERERAEIVGILAHDLRSPLTGICLASAWLERAGHRAERARARSLIERECGRLAAIADEVLQSCQENNKEIDRAGVRIAADQLLVDVANRLQTQTGISTQIALVSAATAKMFVDPSVARAVGNLAENAVRHAPPGTPVVLGLGTTGLGDVEFVIEDDGSGFDLDTLSAAFVQGADCPGRFGLGLASVRQVAAAVGGEARFESRSGGGTRVSLRIPQVHGSA